MASSSSSCWDTVPLSRRASRRRCRCESCSIWALASIELALVDEARLLERQDGLVQAIELLHELGLAAEHLELQVGVLELQEHLAAGHEGTLLDHHFGHLPAFDGIEIGRGPRHYDGSRRHVFREHRLPYGRNHHAGFAHDHRSSERVANVQRHENGEQHRRAHPDQQPPMAARLCLHPPVHRRELLLLVLRHQAGTRISGRAVAGSVMAPY